MKRKLAALAAGLMLLTGCDATELGGRALIQAAAVDHDGEDYIVSALLFSSGGGSGGEIDPSNENVIKVTGRGPTFAAAVDDISLTDGKEIYMSELRLLVIGGGFAETELTPVLETAARDMRCSLNMLVCYSDDPELLTDLHFTEGITAAEKPVSMIENACRSGKSPKTSLLDVLNDTAAGRKTLIPMFTPERNGFGMTSDEDGITVVLSGSRVLSDGVLTDTLDSRASQGELLLSGGSDRALLSFSVGGREYTCEAYCIRAELLENGAVKLSAKFRRRNGGELPDEVKEAAMEELDSVIGAALSAR